MAPSEMELAQVRLPGAHFEIHGLAEVLLDELDRAQEVGRLARGGPRRALRGSP